MNTTKGSFKFASDTFERNLLIELTKVPLQEKIQIFAKQNSQAKLGFSCPKKTENKNLLVYSEKCPPTSSVEHLVRHQFVSNVSNDETHMPPLQSHPVSECALVAILNLIIFVITLVTIKISKDLH